MSWKQFQKWINQTGYWFKYTNSNHAMLYLPNGYTVFLGPHNSPDGINQSKLKEIADCLGITRDQLVAQIDAC